MVRDHRKDLQAWRTAYAREVAYYRADEPEHLTMAAAQNAMFEQAHSLLSGRTPREIRKTAAFVIRCNDCDGRAIAWIAWVGGRPLFMGNEDRGGKRAVVSLLDEPEFAAPDFCCRKATYKLGYDVSLDDLPGRGDVGLLGALRMPMPSIVL